MAEVASTGDRRPQGVAMVGFLIQLASLVVLLLITFRMDSDAAFAVSRLVAIGVPVWLALYLILKQIRRVEMEALEAAELERTRAAGMSTAIFESDQEGFFIEQGRLNWLVRWMLPAVTIFLSLKLLVGNFSYWSWTFDNAFDKGVFRLTQDPTLAMWIVVAIGFANFLYSRYVLALARLSGWRLLHAGAVSMAANAIVCLGLAIALMTTSSLPWAEPLVGYLVRLILIILGIEFAVNFTLDFYRPRARGEVPRPSFDSRLLGLVSEPGGIARSIAEAVNYQFGFEVSSTWFYQLLQRWMFPIMVFTFVAVLGLTSVVIIDAGEEVVIERWGRPVHDGDEVLGPGLYFKWPYPIDVVYRAPSQRVNEITLGEATQEDDHDARRAILWTESHDYVPELMVLVASPVTPNLPRLFSERTEVDRTSSVSESVPVSLLMISVPIHYRIHDIRKFLYKYAEPVRLLEAVAYQFLTDYAAGMNLDDLMGPGRDAINRQLKDLIQKRVDGLDMGVEIVFAGIRGAHPPSRDQVAAAFQQVVSAQTSMGSTVHAAEGEARKILINAAGSESAARALDEAIRARDRLRSNPETPAADLAAADALVNDLLVGHEGKGIAPVGGMAASMIATARVNARAATSDARVKSRLFETQVAAHAAAPRLFEQRKLLEVFAGLDLVRKFMVVGDASNVTVIYETAEQAGLDRVLSEGLDKERSNRSR